MRRLLLAFLTFSGTLSATQNPCKGIDKTVLEKHTPLKGLPYKIVKEEPVKGICEVVIEINGELVPLYVTEDFVISGELFANKKPLTQIHLKEIQKEILRKRKQTFDKYTVAVYRPKNFKGFYIYFIADPECPYCNYIKKTVKNLADKYGVGIKLVFLPLPFHPHAKKWMESFICSNATFEDYVNDTYPKNRSCKLPERNILKDLAFIKATPAFIAFTRNGVKLIVGANKKRLEALFSRLSENKMEK